MSDVIKARRRTVEPFVAEARSMTGVWLAANVTEKIESTQLKVSKIPVHAHCSREIIFLI